MKRLLSGLWALACLTGVALANNDNDPSTVDLPQVLHYEGSVTVQGAPYTGELDMRFSLRLGPKADLEEVWSETWDAGTRRVTVTAGRFQANLGTHEAIPARIWEVGDAWLKIAVKRPGAAAFTELAGMHRVATVPAALWSARARDLVINGAVEVAGPVYADTLEGTSLQIGGAIAAGAAQVGIVRTPEASFRTLTVNGLTANAGALDGREIAAGNVTTSDLTVNRLFLSDGIEADPRLNFVNLGSGGSLSQLFYHEFGGALHLSYSVLPFTTVRVAGNRVVFGSDVTAYGSLIASHLGSVDTTAMTATAGSVVVSATTADTWTSERLQGNECSICLRASADGQHTHSCTPLDVGGAAVNINYLTSRNGDNALLGLAYVCSGRYRQQNSGGLPPGL
ncbi:MAG: hypothetical protein KC613_13300 [Myxococcales bacterium]|nr:hypothetical protein [Myxococcales bacterium]